MSINIFSGTGNSGRTKVSNRASNTVRAKAARAALADPGAEVSSSGTTAVSTKSTLSKVGNAVGKIAGVASKFLPGIGGTIAGAISNLFNDPEWWQSVPGDALTLNEPLRFINEALGSGSKVPDLAARVSILEITVARSYAASVSGAFGDEMSDAFSVFLPTEQMITQYLMPEIRKVVNAIPLQNAPHYSAALKSAATIYALWRQLRKYDYMCKHGQTYLASMNDSAFPLFKTENAAWLQSTINRLEEYLRANVRIPHTLCEYLSWRFGRVYKSNASVKSALVLYDVLPLEYAPKQWDQVIAAQMNIIARNAAVQHANTDLYNTYIDHDYMVEVRDDTQFRYDMKEFMLRLNLTGGEWLSGPTRFEPTPINSLVAIDSSLDNPTAFMASTVSATGRSQDGSYEVLFPVSNRVIVYIPSPQQIPSDLTTEAYYVPEIYYDSTSDPATVVLTPLVRKARSYDGNGPRVSSTLWRAGEAVIDGSSSLNSTGIASAILLKAVDMYNCHINIPIFKSELESQTYDARVASVDQTTLSIDAGSPTYTTINTEHIYAFANLVDISRKHSMSYKQAERLVARDTAELIDKLDVGVAGDVK